MPCATLIIELDHEDWARKMQILLRRACHAVNLARERGIPLKPRLVARIERRYDAIMAEGLAFHEALPPLRRAQRRSGEPRRGGPNLLPRPAPAKERRVAVSARSECALHQQPSRSRRPHDEATAENLRWIPCPRQRRRLRGHPIRALDRQKAKLEYPQNAHARA